MGEVGRDLVHAITHADHSIVALIRALLTRPGNVAREYIEGRRKGYFGPFAFLVIMVGLASAAILIFDVQWFAPFGHGRAAELLQRHINLVILLQAPLLAAACAVFFQGARRSFAEHLVLVAYTSGFRALFLALVETPVLAATGPHTQKPWLTVAYFAIWVAYFSFAATQFYRGGRAGLALRASAAAILSQAVTIASIMAFLYLTSAHA
jgi:hypothetical protein